MKTKSIYHKDALPDLQTCSLMKFTLLKPGNKLSLTFRENGVLLLLLAHRQEKIAFIALFEIKGNISINHDTNW